MNNQKKILFGTFLLSIGSIASAGTVNSIITVPQSVPAISQAGLIGLAFVVGIIGARLISKFKTAKT